MNKILIGSVLCIGKNRYRVIYVDDANTFMIQLDIDSTEFLIYSNNVMEMITKAIDLEEPELHKTIEINKLKDSVKEKYYKAREIIKEIETKYGPTYVQLKERQKTGYIKLLSVKYDVSVKTIWKYIRNYLQSGFDYNSLIDARLFYVGNQDEKSKRGPKNKYEQSSTIVFDSTVKNNADTIIKRFKGSKKMKRRAAYQEFINKFYSVYNPETGQHEWLPKNQRPSFRQFDYYMSKQISEKEMDEIKTSKLEVLNNKRVLKGSSRTNAIRPGWIVECDAVEVDISLVSDLDNQKTIGRPIMYVMIDVLTSCILAVSASYENNSIIGLTNLFLNLCDNKYDFCKNYNLIIDPIKWPSNVIPHEIRCDRGSDFVSLKFKEICKLLNINLNYEAPGVGSLKGLVEQTFHQFHESIMAKIEDYGAITKRHDSKHHEQAMFTLTGFMKLVVNYVIYHNMHVIKDYPLSKQMLKDPNFSAAPYLLWQHYAAQSGVTAQINESNRVNFLYNLLIHDTAPITSKGLKYKKLYYLNDDEYLLDLMYQSKRNHKRIDIKYDPRNTSKLYYSINGVIKEIKLNESIPNQRDYKNMTWIEYEDYFNKKQKIENQHLDHHLELNSQLKLNLDYIIEEEKTKVLPSTKDITKNRKIAKFEHNKSNAIDLHLDDNNNKEISTSEENIVPETHNIFENLDDDNFNNALSTLFEMMKGG